MFKPAAAPARPHVAGFTMVELICVILILAILSAVAIPRFADMRADARITRMQALVGALRAGISMAHAQWLLAGSQGSFTLPDGSVVTYVGVAPSAGSVALVVTPESLQGSQPMVSNGSTNKGTAVFCLPDSSDSCGTGPGFCSFKYTVDTSLPDGYSISTTQLTAANCSK